mmetsp:Transcript_13346/g.38408  ORF Transcript_13346/g.38408 Transcript_13346/m.38408 type:complete len:202 (+) Transcript_13346:1606-2211(+)
MRRASTLTARGHGRGHPATCPPSATASSMWVIASPGPSRPRGGPSSPTRSTTAARPPKPLICPLRATRPTDAASKGLHPASTPAPGRQHRPPRQGGRNARRPTSRTALRGSRASEKMCFASPRLVPPRAEASTPRGRHRLRGQQHRRSFGHRRPRPPRQRSPRRPKRRHRRAVRRHANRNCFVSPRARLSGAQAPSCGAPA